MAAQKLLDRTGLSRSDIAVWEINEAFSAVAIASARNLGMDEGEINQFGGAVAMGHPIGASGARLVGTVINQLRKRGGGLRDRLDLLGRRPRRRAARAGRMKRGARALRLR